MTPVPKIGDKVLDIRALFKQKPLYAHKTRDSNTYRLNGVLGNKCESSDTYAYL